MPLCSVNLKELSFWRLCGQHPDPHTRAAGENFSNHHRAVASRTLAKATLYEVKIKRPQQKDESTKLLSSTHFSKSHPIRSKNKETTTEEQLTRWEQYYSELLEQNPNFSEVETDQLTRWEQYYSELLEQNPNFSEVETD
ncbi:hypothetical protein QE152_g34194 [Popillia japonica]|uniref:Uncharacterized protein n=1 Tax=Popillia japonica TaxID=7064 RepID=A0AAW1ITR4_POPJA